MLKPTITIGRDEGDNLRVLYIGNDPEAAIQAIRNLPEDIVEAEVYRKPRHFKRVQVTPTANELPAVEPEAESDSAGVQGEQSPLEQIASDKVDDSAKPKAPKAAKRK